MAMQSSSTQESADDVNMSGTSNNPAVPAVAALPKDINAFVADCLQQQSSQFQTIIEGLQSQIHGLQLPRNTTSTPAAKKTTTTTSTSKSGKSTSKTPMTVAQIYSTPTPAARKASGSAQASGSAPRKAPTAAKSPSSSTKNPKTAAAPRKSNPLQLLKDETPGDFKTMKVRHFSFLQV